mmetsp:Transcript_5523/g.17472  ORF Transcript_5523/g.17472 Transcript_5523/m.17472 type:complete len:363 (-) Transcript_5523:765-1853(-)
MPSIRRSSPGVKPAKPRQALGSLLRAAFGAAPLAARRASSAASLSDSQSYLSGNTVRSKTAHCLSGSVSAWWPSCWCLRRTSSAGVIIADMWPFKAANLFHCPAAVPPPMCSKVVFSAMAVAVAASRPMMRPVACGRCLWSHLTSFVHSAISNKESRLSARKTRSPASTSRRSSLRDAKSLHQCAYSTSKVRISAKSCFRCSSRSSMRSSSSATSVLHRSVSASHRADSTSASSNKAPTTRSLRSPRRIEFQTFAWTAFASRNRACFSTARFVSAATWDVAQRAQCASTLREYFVAEAAPTTTWYAPGLRGLASGLCTMTVRPSAVPEFNCCKAYGAWPTETGAASPAPGSRNKATARRPSR